jgi:hypothetical protein
MQLELAVNHVNLATREMTHWTEPHTQLVPKEVATNPQENGYLN